ncbi:MAG: DNA polymerase III subunit delta [Hespellia sp.]|nr:DNA polymerase III subunit delta [Hespellia sp.]
MKSLNEDLKSGQFKNIYLLYGEEAYLKKMYKDRLSKALLPEGDTMNYAYYEGKHVNIKEVIDLAETVPFFAERRLIVLENTGFFKSAATDLADYLKETPDTTFFLFIETEVDKRSKMYKAIKNHGRAVELPFQDEATLKRWILGFVKREDRQITEKALNHLLNKVGTDMENIQKELEKLFCYTLGREEITVADIDAVCVTQITNHIFEMINAVADGNQRKALSLYYDLLALREPPMRILYLMTRQFRLLLQVKDLQRLGYAQKEIASRAGIHPFAAKKCMGQTRYFGTSELRTILEESARMEEAVKTGRLTDTLSVEIFIVKYSSRARA